MLNNVNDYQFSETLNQPIHILLVLWHLVKDGTIIITFFHGITKFQSCQDIGVTFLLRSLTFLLGLVRYYVII